MADCLPGIFFVVGFVDAWLGLLPLLSRGRNNSEGKVNSE